METRVLTAEEAKLSIWNCLTYKADFRRCTNKCKNCGYPISALDGGGFYSVYAEGVTCDACHTIEASVKDRTWFKDAHQEWVSLKNKMKRLKPGNDYFN